MVDDKSKTPGSPPDTIDPEKHPLLVGMEEDAIDAPPSEETLAPEPTAEAPVETPPVEPPVTAAEETVEPAANQSYSYRDVLREHGQFQDLSEDDAENHARLGAYFDDQRAQSDRLKQMEEELAQQRSLTSHYQYQVQQQPPQTPAPETTESPTEDPSKWFSPPVSNAQSASQYQEQDESGNLQWKANTPADVRGAHEAEEAYYRDYHSRLLYDPQNTVTPPHVVEHMIQTAIREALDGYDGQTKQQSFNDRFIAETPWMFAVDPVTNQSTNEYSEQGQMLANLANEFHGKGMGERDAWETAKTMMVIQQPQASSPAAPAPAVAAPTAEQVASEKKQDLLRRQATSIPARGGSIPASEEAPTQDPMVDWGSRLYERLVEDEKRQPV